MERKTTCSSETLGHWVLEIPLQQCYEVHISRDIDSGWNAICEQSRAGNKVLIKDKIEGEAESAIPSTIRQI